MKSVSKSLTRTGKHIGLGCDTVSELTDELKSAIALPAITRTIVSELINNQLSGWNLERMRANGILDFNEWSVELV